MSKKKTIKPGDIVEVLWRDHWWETSATVPDASWDDEWVCVTVGMVVENRDDTLVVAHEWSLNNYSYRGVTHLLKATIIKCFVYGKTDHKFPVREGVLQRV